MIDKSKLSKKVQEYINDIELERDNFKKKLDDFLESQTPSEFYTDNMICTPTSEVKNRFIRRYIQAHRITAKIGGITADIYNRDGLMEISVSDLINSGSLAIQPVASNCFYLISVMR